MAARPTVFSIVCEDAISKSASLAVVVIASNVVSFRQACKIFGGGVAVTAGS